MPQHVIAALERHPTLHGRTVEAEHRTILDAAPRAGFWERAAALREETRGRISTPSEDVIRQDGFAVFRPAGNKQSTAIPIFWGHRWSLKPARINREQRAEVALAEPQPLAPPHGRPLVKGQSGNPAGRTGLIRWRPASGSRPAGRRSAPKT